MGFDRADAGDTSAVRRSLVGTAALVLALTACGGGGGQSEETAIFCDRAEEVDAYLDEGLEFGDVSDEDVIIALEDLTDVAPDEIFDDVDIVREAYTIAVDEGDRGIFDEPEVQDASDSFADYLDEECGITD